MKKLTLLTILTISICVAGALLGLWGVFENIIPLMVLGLTMMLGMMVVYHVVKHILTRN